MAHEPTARVTAGDLARTGIVLLSTLVAVIVGIVLFVSYPRSFLDLVGVLLVIAIGLLGVRTGGGLAAKAVAPYDVAEVAVEGPITRDGGRRFPSGPGSVPADDVVEQIEAADADRSAEGLLVKLNTPGGEVVPSDDIRRAIESFDGPTVAYATDVCGSGGYWIASGCDEVLARDASLVGSIGVLGSRVNAEGMAEKLGLSYERFAAGRYKDTGTPLRSMDEDERTYLQGLIDDYYDRFVEVVASGRDLDPQSVRDTEARVYLGEEALELGLIDGLGTREDAMDRLADHLDRPAVSVQPFEPSQGLLERFRLGAEAMAFALGSGLAGVLADRTDRTSEIRL